MRSISCSRQKPNWLGRPCYAAFPLPPLRTAEDLRPPCWPKPVLQAQHVLLQPLLSICTKKNRLFVVKCISALKVKKNMFFFFPLTDLTVSSFAARNAHAKQEVCWNVLFCVSQVSECLEAEAEGNTLKLP